MKQQQDILEELKELSNVLYAIKKNQQQPIVPSAYFEQIQQDTLEKIQDTNLAFLAKIDKTITDIPPNYFDTLENNLLKKITVQETSVATHIIPWQKNVSYAIAAMLTGVFILVGYQWMNTASNQVCEDGLACLTQEEIQEYVSKNMDEFSAHEVGTIFDVTSITIPEETAILEEVVTQESTSKVEINEQVIDTYIEENPTAIEDLTEEESYEIF